MNQILCTFDAQNCKQYLKNNGKVKEYYDGI